MPAAYRAEVSVVPYAKGSRTLMSPKLLPTYVLTLFLIIVVGTLFAGPGTEATRTISVTDTGASPDDGQNDWAGINQALQKAADAESGAAVRFAEGTYRVSRPNDEAAWRKVQEQRRTAYGRYPSLQKYFTLRDARGLTIDGRGATLLLDAPTTGLLSVEGCRDCTIKNLTIDYSTLPFTQGTVRSVDREKKSVDLQVDSGYPSPSRFDLQSNFPKITSMVYSSSTKLWKVPVLFPGSMHKQDERRWRIGLNTVPEVLQVGDRFTLQARSNVLCALNESDGIAVRNLTIFTGPGTVFSVWKSDDFHADAVRIRRKPGTGRLASAMADAFHVKQCRSGPTIENCFVEALGDDIINISGVPAFIRQAREDGKVLVARACGRRDAQLRTGDRVLAYDVQSGRVRGEARVTELTQVDDRGLSKRMRIRLDTALDGLSGSDENNKADRLFNLDAMNSGSVVRRNYFRNSRRCALLCRAVDMTVDNNTFEHLRAGVNMYSSLNIPEGGIPRNVTIRHNIFEDIGYCGYRHNPGNTAVGATLYRFQDTPFRNAAGRGIKNLVITNNKFINPPKFAIHVRNAEEVRIQGNTIWSDSSNCDYRGRAVPVWLQNSRDVSIDRLLIEDMRPALQAGIVVGKKVEYLRLQSIKMRLEADEEPILRR